MKQAMVGWMAVGVLGVMAAEAHLINGSLSVKGGEKLKPGDVVQVKWGVEAAHDPFKYEISLSTNGGTSFQKIDNLTLQGTGTKTYAWTVPNSASTTAQIKVCQWFSSTSCLYPLQSSNFTIGATTAIDAVKEAEESSLRFNPTSGNLDVAFRLDREEAVTLTAFDAQGKVAAILLDSRFSVGVHALSVFSTRLTNAGTLVFQLKVGGKVSILEPATLR